MQKKDDIGGMPNMEWKKYKSIFIEALSINQSSFNENIKYNADYNNILD